MQPTPAQIVAAIVESDKRPLYRIESEAGIGHGIVRLWLRGDRAPRSDLLIAVANACGAEIVAQRGDGGR